METVIIQPGIKVTLTLIPIKVDVTLIICYVTTK